MAPAEAGAVHAGLTEDDWALMVYVETQFNWLRCKEWIATLPDAPLKEQMIGRLASGDAALRSGNIDRAKRDYEFLLMSQRETELKQHLVPPAKRDHTLQESKRKPRGSKMPVLDGWLDSKLCMGFAYANDQLFDALPSDMDDWEKAGVYSDGDAVIEYDGDKRHEITRAGFLKRCTAARKRQAVSN